MLDFQVFIQTLTTAFESIVKVLSRADVGALLDKIFEFVSKVA